VGFFERWSEEGWERGFRRFQQCSFSAEGRRREVDWDVCIDSDFSTAAPVIVGGQGRWTLRLTGCSLPEVQTQHPKTLSERGHYHTSAKKQGGSLENQAQIPRARRSL
jgi:hypothetical protein